MENKLKSTISYRASNVDGLNEEEILSHEKVYQKTSFDEKGNVLSEETITPEGILEHKAVYAYTAEGLIREEILMEEDDFVSEHRTMEYNSEGKLITERLHYLDESYDETVFEYDSAGLLISKITTDSDGEITSKVFLSYENGKLVKESEHNEDGDELSSSEFKFDEEGNLVEEIYKGGAEEYASTHEYDADGHRKVSRKYNNYGHLIERYTYTRDESGRLTGVKEESASGIELMHMEYDEAGNVILQESTTESEEVVSRIERTYIANNLVNTSTVYIAGKGQRTPQNYRLRFDYGFWPE